MQDELLKYNWRWQDFGNGLILVTDGGDAKVVLAADASGQLIVRDERGILRPISANDEVARRLGSVPAMIRAAGGFEPEYRHVRRGANYQVMAQAKLQTEAPLADDAELVVYRDHEGNWWARPPTEFNDGRFEQISEAAPIQIHPDPPWPIGPDNAKREGWKAFFEGRGARDHHYPQARPDLHAKFNEGWVEAHSKHGRARS